MAPPNTRRILANGIDHFVYDFSLKNFDSTSTDKNDSSTPPILLLHGFMDSISTFDAVADHLCAAGFQVLGFDWRGHGKSSWVSPSGYYHFYDYIFDLYEILNVLDLQKVHLVAHSMGGTAATLFAGSYPDKIASLTLIEGVGPEDAAEEDPAERIRQWIDSSTRLQKREEKPMSLENAAKRLALQNPTLSQSELENIAKKLTKEHQGSRVWNFDPRHRTKSPKTFSAKEYIRFAKQITCRVHFIGGENGFHPTNEAERLHAFSELEHNTIEDAGHMLHWTHAKQLSHLIESFLSKENET